MGVLPRRNSDHAGNARARRVVAELTLKNCPVPTYPEARAHERRQSRRLRRPARRVSARTAPLRVAQVFPQDLECSAKFLRTSRRKNDNARQTLYPAFQSPV